MYINNINKKQNSIDDEKVSNFEALDEKITGRKIK